MTVKYNVVERGNPSDPGSPKKFYASITASGRLTLRQLTGRITEISTLSSADVMAVLEALLTVIPQELAAGNIVELGDFGNFWLKANSEGSVTARDVLPDNITKLLVRFHPGREFKKVLNSVKLEKGT